MENRKTIDINTGTREECEFAFTEVRDDIWLRIIRLFGQLAIVNTNRFQDEMIDLELDFTKQLMAFSQLPAEQQIGAFNQACTILAARETPQPVRRIVTLDDVRSKKVSGIDH